MKVTSASASSILPCLDASSPKLSSLSDEWFLNSLNHKPFVVVSSIGSVGSSINVFVVKTFIEACIHAIALDGREGVSLKVLSWKKVAKALKDNHNFEANQKQMRNHFDYMKLKYGAWLFLKNMMGNIYDDSTNTFNLTEEEWELEIMKNKNVKPLKTTVLHFPELCAQLFDGTMATGIKGGGPSSHEPVYVGEPHMVEDADATKVPNTKSSKATSKAPCAVKNKRKHRQPTDGVEEEILGVLKVIAEKIVESEPPRKLKPPTLEDCQGKLIDLKWVEDDPLYEVALAIFCEPNDRYREGWMKLKPERYVGWVKMIGRSKGFM
ncbi:Myb/SANT-like domain-containing protein [Tanacetum coccineum]|uniref:Myb/SANT-like domain-containing protein n=1 Tax=Tanacetum coccineum TaxID=301880 RepID=A0ABQ4ZFN4_9ASTR